MAIAHMESFPGQYSTSMGPRFLSAFYKSYLDQGTAFVALSDNQVVGHIVGGPRGIRDAFMRGSFRQFWPLILWRLLTNRVVCVTFLTRIWSTLRRRVVRSPRTNKPAPGDRQSAWLQVICLRPTAHGTGLAGQLLDRFRREMKALGYETIRLSVASSNARAISFYVKCGFEAVDEDDQHLVFETTT